MKPLLHPSVDDITVEGILHALSDPVRARIYAALALAECPQACCAFQIQEDRTLAKSTLSQHFSVLREAGLIRSVRKGVEIQNVTRCGELGEKFGPMLEGILRAYGKQIGLQEKPKAKEGKAVKTAKLVAKVKG